MEISEVIKRIQKIKWDYFHIGNPLQISEYERDDSNKSLKFVLTILERIDVRKFVEVIKTVAHAIKLENPQEIDWDWEHANLAHALITELTKDALEKTE